MFVSFHDLIPLCKQAAYTVQKKKIKNQHLIFSAYMDRKIAWATPFILVSEWPYVYIDNVLPLK